MQAIYDHYEILSLGVIIGPIAFIAGFFLRKRRVLSRTLLVFGIVSFVFSSLLVYKFIEGEKEIARIRESQEKK